MCPQHEVWESHILPVNFPPSLGPPESPWLLWTCNWKRVGRCLPPCSVGLLVTKQVWSVTAQLSQRTWFFCVMQPLTKASGVLITTSDAWEPLGVVLLWSQLQSCCWTGMIWPSCLGGNYGPGTRGSSLSLPLPTHEAQPRHRYFLADEID